MKRVLFVAIVALSALVTACKFDNKYEESDYSLVYPGIIIYNYATATHNLAMDGLSVATRMVILLEEMEQAGVEFDAVTGEVADWDDLGDFEYSTSVSYQKKEFLFGEDAVIKEVVDGYTITYGDDDNHTLGIYDKNPRRGTYHIATKDNAKFEDTKDVDDCWEVTILGDEVTFSSQTALKEPVIECSATSTKLWSDSEEWIGFSASTELSNGKSDAEWRYNGTLNVTGSSILIEDTIGKDFALTISDSRGSTLAGVSDMQYYTTSPIIYNVKGGGHAKIGGTEIAFMNDADPAIYPEPTVKVSFSPTGSATVYYNGATYVN